MITFIRTLSIMPGRTAEALAFAGKVRSYIKEKYNQEMSVSAPVAGNPHRLAFITTAASLADFEAVMGVLAADAEYQQIVATNAANLVPGSVHDELWRAL